MSFGVLFIAAVFLAAADASSWASFLTTKIASALCLCGAWLSMKKSQALAKGGFHDSLEHSSRSP